MEWFSYLEIRVFVFWSLVDVFLVVWLCLWVLIGIFVVRFYIFFFVILG